MKFIDTSKSILENLYLVSGPVIAIFGFYIFKQIKMAKGQLEIAKQQLDEAKKQLLISSKRDSIKLAAEQIYFFMNDIIPCVNLLNEEIKKTGIKPITFTSKEFNINDIKIHFKDIEIKKYHETISPLVHNYLDVVNRLETFATYFTQEVADENVAF